MGRGGCVRVGGKDRQTEGGGMCVHVSMCKRAYAYESCMHACVRGFRSWGGVYECR